MWPRRLGLVLAGLLGGLVIAEVAVGLLDLDPTFEPVPGDNYRIIADPELKYDLVPGSDYLGTPINEGGMRDRPRETAKPPGHFRIACVGDSVTFGLYVRQEETFPARLEAMLNEAKADDTTYEVLNFGVTGYGIGQYAASVRKRALSYSPDLILLGYCLNDPSEFSVEFVELRSRMNPKERRYLDDVLHQSSRFATRLHLYRLYSYVWRAEAHNWGYSGDSTVNPNRGRYITAADYYREFHQSGPGWERVLDGFAAIASAAEVRRIPVVVAIVPMLDELDDYCCADIHARVRIAAEQHGFHVIDLLEPLQMASKSSSEKLRKDELHPSPAGHKIIAEALLRGLEERDLLPAGISAPTGNVDP